jgi:hypothetical protein
MSIFMILVGVAFTLYLVILAGFYLLLVIGFWAAMVKSKGSGSPYP